MQKERATSTRVPTRRQSKNHFQASEFAHIQQVKRNMPLLQFCTCVSRERALIYGPTFLSCTCPRQAFSDAIVRQSVKQEHQSAGMTPCQKPNFIHTSRCGALSLSLYTYLMYTLFFCLLLCLITTLASAGDRTRRPFLTWRTKDWLSGPSLGMKRKRRQGPWSKSLTLVFVRPAGPMDCCTTSSGWS